MFLGVQVWVKKDPSCKQTHTSQLSAGEMVNLDAMQFLHRQKGIWLIIKGMSGAGGETGLLVFRRSDECKSRHH